MGTKRRVHVKPVMSNCGLFGWVVLELTPWENFLDDWRRYGIKVAVQNVGTAWALG